MPNFNEGVRQNKGSVAEATGKKMINRAISK